MQAAQRRMEIFDDLQRNKTVEVNALANHYRVTPMTIRRDLAIFQKQGLVTTTYGGAYLNQGAAVEPNFALKSSQMKEGKQLIARRAASLVNEGETIIIDCGSTAYELAKYIAHMNITVITNSLPVMNILKDHESIKLIMAPGQYNHVSAGALSTYTLNFYRELHADKVFMSTQGFDERIGLSVPDMEDAAVKKVILQAAREKILLADMSKYKREYLAVHAKLEDFSIIVNDGKFPSDVQQRLEAKKIRVYTVDVDHDAIGLSSL